MHLVQFVLSTEHSEHGGWQDRQILLVTSPNEPSVHSVTQVLDSKKRSPEQESHVEDVEQVSQMDWQAEQAPELL